MFQQSPLSKIDRSSVTWILLIINITVFLAWQFMPYEIMVSYFLSIPRVFNVWTLLANVSHSSVIHILWNMYMLWMLWPIIERYIQQRSYIWLVLVSSLISSLAVFLFASGPTLGFSWIVMGLVSFAYFSGRIPLQKDQLWIILVINIVAWFSSWISFVGHFAGALWWWIYSRYMNR